MTNTGQRSRSNRIERAVVKLLKEAGLAGRMDLSTVADIKVSVMGVTDGEKFDLATIDTWLKARDILLFKDHGREPIVVLPLRLAAEMASAVERSRG